MSAEQHLAVGADDTGPQPPTTGTVAAIDVSAEPSIPPPEFGPLGDPPRVEGVELIGEPEGGEGHAEAVSSDLANETPLALESGEVGSTPLRQRVGYLLPKHVMQRASEVREETAAIAADVTEIEKANPIVESLDDTGLATTAADTKEPA